MKKDRKKMWRRVLEFIIAVLLGMILHGLVRNLVAEADAKAYEFIVPDVDIEYLSSADIQDMPLQVVCYAKNEIYARHGRQFVTDYIADYFNSKSWYQGTIDPELLMQSRVPFLMSMKSQTSIRSSSGKIKKQVKETEKF